MRGYIWIILISLFFEVNAKTLRVNNKPELGAPYQSIGAAVAAAGPNDIIQVEGSEIAYAENLTINKKVKIIGPGYFLAENGSQNYNKESAKISGTITFTANSDGSLMAGMEQYNRSKLSPDEAGFISAPYAGWNGPTIVINAGADNITISNCRLFFVDLNNNSGSINGLRITQSWFSPGVIKSRGWSSVSVEIANCFFRNTGGEPDVVYITEFNSASKIVIRNSTFYGEFRIRIPQDQVITDNVFFATTSKATTSMPKSKYSSGNIFNKSGFGGMSDAGGNSYNKETDPAKWFSGEGSSNSDGFFFPDPDGPVSDKGMYSGNPPYVPSGHYSAPEVYQLDVPETVKPGSAMQVTIKAIAK